MEVTLEEKLVLATIRVFSKFPGPLAFVAGLSIYSLDGGYVEFLDIGSSKIWVQLFPEFRISLVKKRTFKYMFRQFPPSINLIEEKKKIPPFSNLPEVYENEDDLMRVLNGYKQLIETHFLRDGKLTF